ncbi:MAG: hypothetical protein Q8O63_12080 [Hoeflea sp.]|nr:hypothetical protein [Hoeflea sp.]
MDRAIRDLERLLAKLQGSRQVSEFSIARLHSLGVQLLTYIRSNRGAIVDYGKRYRAGLRVATTLAESAVNSLVGKRMVNFAIDCGHLFDSLKRMCRRYSNQNRPSCVPPNPSKITGLTAARAKRLFA